MLFQTNIAELKMIPTPRSRATSWNAGPKKGGLVGMQTGEHQAGE